MINLNQNTTCNQLKELSRTEMKNITGGNDSAWYSFWKWVGKQVGMATIPNMETYNHEAELEALQNYGAPY